MMPAGKDVALATLHGKAEALGPALSPLGFALHVVAADTDALGTFSGDIERPGPPAEVVVAKARLGMALSGLPLGIATEASFGPDPVVGFMPIHHELLAFVDDARGQVLVLEHATHDTNWQSKSVRAPEEAESLLLASGFPAHALLVRPNVMAPGLPARKGIRTRDALAAAIRELAALSPDGRARVDTDMRAHMNPTRLRHIASLGRQLARRLATPCPACDAPGFGRTAALAGLPCSGCGMPTGRLRAERHGCGICGHHVEVARRDGLEVADPGECPSCNP
ncbi:MAG: DUF6671 family protein [Arenimonas sp.]